MSIDFYLLEATVTLYNVPTEIRKNLEKLIRFNIMNNKAHFRWIL